LCDALEALKSNQQQQLSRFNEAKKTPEIKALIKSFDRAILETERKIRLCVRENAHMQTQRDLLCSIPGIAERIDRVPGRGV
jgi:hypothetical protein